MIFGTACTPFLEEEEEEVFLVVAFLQAIIIVIIYRRKDQKTCLSKWRLNSSILTHDAHSFSSAFSDDKQNKKTVREV